MMFIFFFCKQKTAYEMRISDWSSDVCSSDLHRLDALDIAILRRAPGGAHAETRRAVGLGFPGRLDHRIERHQRLLLQAGLETHRLRAVRAILGAGTGLDRQQRGQLHRGLRSEEHTSELQSLMRNSYAVFCLKKKNKNLQHDHQKSDR